MSEIRRTSNSHNPVRADGMGENAMPSNDYSGLVTHARDSTQSRNVTPQSRRVIEWITAEDNG